MIRQTLRETTAPLVIGADGGARFAAALGLTLDHIIGDMDSLTPAEVTAFEAAGVSIHRYPEEKNETDLELALLFAVEQGCEQIRVLGATGGRLDQLLGNILLLALPALRGRDVRLVADNQATWLLFPGENNISGAEGDTLSLIPWSDEVADITTENLYYPLNHESLIFGPARGISNVMTAERACVRVGSGRLLAVHTMGRA